MKHTNIYNDIKILGTNYIRVNDIVWNNQHTSLLCYEKYEETILFKSIFYKVFQKELVNVNQKYEYQNEMIHEFHDRLEDIFAKKKMLVYDINMGRGKS